VSLRKSGREAGFPQAFRLAPLVFSAALLQAGLVEAQQASPLTEAAQREIQAIDELLVKAVSEFDGPQQGRSIVLFEDIIGQLDRLKQRGGLTPHARTMLAQAYEYRGRAYFNIGLQEKAAESFRSLIQLQPQWAISKEKVSPKIVDAFNQVKKSIVGYLAVNSKPAGAKVSLNGEFLGLTDFFPMDVIAGDYTVEIARDGFRTETRTVAVAPRATEIISVDLVRTLASSFFITEPTGVEIWVDGELKATTSGSLSPELASEARAKGLDPGRASARTEAANLSLGSHIVELKMKCHETIRRTVELTEPKDYFSEPVRLEESVASLQLRSEPPGARIFLDGESKGLTPKDLDGICSGPHRLEVKHASGKFTQDLVLAKNESLTLNCPIRPSLAFLGVVAESASGERIVADVEEKLIQNLSKITTLNFIAAPRETVDRTLDSEKLTRKSLISGSSPDGDAVRKVTEKLATALEVQGFLIALLPEERLQRTAVLHLLAAGNTISDPWDVIFSEQASYLRFISAVDQKATVYRPWTGLITVDTMLHEGVPVLRVVPGSPASQFGVQAGEILYAVDGKPVKRTADFLSLVEKEKKAKDKISLSLRGATGSNRTLELSLEQTPQEIPLNEPTLLYNKIMMDLRQQVEGYPGTEAAAFARLNLAICAMHFDDFAAAHEHLLKARAELPQRPGLSQGTALYYLGVSLEQLNYRKEAVEAYRAAAAFKDATLFNNDGPAVSPLASRRASP